MKNTRHIVMNCKEFILFFNSMEPYQEISPIVSLWIKQSATEFGIWIENHDRLDIIF